MRLRLYATNINDIQVSANSAISNSDLNTHSLSSVSSRLDHLAECLNQQNQVVSENTVKIQSLVSSLDQFKANTERWLSVFEDRIKSHRVTARMEAAPIVSPVPVEILGLELDEVVEVLREKVKGLEFFFFFFLIHFFF